MLANASLSPSPALALPWAEIVALLDQAVLVAGPTGLVLDANPAAQTLLGPVDGVLRGRTLDSLLLEPEPPPDSPQPCLWLAPDGGDQSLLTRRSLLFHQGQIFDVLQISPRPTMITAAADQRALFLTRLERAQRSSSGPLAILAVGLDRFDRITATLGHEVGDRVLQAVAERLRTCLSDDDALIRITEKRFLLLLAGLDDPQEIMITVEQIRVRLQDPMTVLGHPIDIAASVGVTISPDDGCDGEQLIRQADTALMQAKASGLGVLARYHPEDRTAATRDFTVQHGLRRAIEQEEFVPFFQPQVDPFTGRLIGMEALVRWATPQGLVSPSEYIPVAEDYGLIDALSEQMLHACGQQMGLWRDQGLPLVPVAINVSGRQFLQPQRLIDTVGQMLEDSGVPPQFFELELTESSAMRDPDSAIATMKKITGLGLHCSIDDFGTGYSSLSVLKRFPLHKLKIDRSFITDVCTDSNDAAIVTALIAMAHALGLTVVAEGVETMEHLAFLRALRCDSIQGYLFSKPLPGDAMTAVLRTGRLTPQPCR